MSARGLVSRIADDFRFDPQAGWVHAKAGNVASADEALKLVTFLYRYYYQGLTDAARYQSDAGEVRSIESLENRELVACFVAELPAADYSSAGWRIVSRRQKRMLVERKGVQLVLMDPEKAEGNQVDEMISVRMPSSRPYASPGFFTGFGPMGPPGGDEKLDRVYFNVDVNSAPKLFGWILRWADARALPVTIKAINAPENYDRRDCLVAYFPRARFHDFRALLGEEVAGLDLSFQPDIPAFTCKMHRGIAWAQDPGSKGAGIRSFGMHRCTVIANGLNRGRMSGTQALQEGIRQEWDKVGLDLDRPYLSPVQ